MAGKKQNLDPMWERLRSKIDLDPPVDFSQNVYLGCKQSHIEVPTKLVEQKSSFIDSLTNITSLQSPLIKKINAWQYDMSGHAAQCVQKYLELSGRDASSLRRVETPSLDESCISEEDASGMVGNLPSSPWFRGSWLM